MKPQHPSVRTSWVMMMMTLSRPICNLHSRGLNAFDAMFFF